MPMREGYRSPTPRHFPGGPSSPGNESSSSPVLSCTNSFSLSATSSYRVNNGPFAPPKGGGIAATPSPPQPVLLDDAQHTPKTTGSVGILIVGLGGANGTTLLAGVLAHRLKIHWKGPLGQGKSPNYNGCITQLNQRGIYGGVGYKDRVKGLADVSLAAIGGWDIRPTKPGDALLEAQILDYDLVRQVKDEMNKIKIFRGVYDPRFIGSSQHETATHVLSSSEAPSDSEALKCLRADIRYFKWRNGVVGHTTVIWSASVEPNCELLPSLKTADDLLRAIEQSQEERGGPLPPSLLYATAALLEGCSFVNGGSQNTLSCPGLNELARQQACVYCLGTDFKAGQTKFKTAAVEYLRTMGLQPRVIASSNHLGNNDMRNLASAQSASKAKLRVKHDIFAPWQEQDLDHKVSIMFTEHINDDKRDFVEYTSMGFMEQPHTMVTYTRASDSVLCVPLMIDAAVWCDYFSSCSWPYDKVAKALAYLFKVPEGAAKGVDPGFFRQMQELQKESLALHEAKMGGKKKSQLRSNQKKRVRIRPDEKATEWAIPRNARIICAGLACVDMQLHQATGHGGEGIQTFQGENSIGGGSVSMACKTLARLCHGHPLDDHYMQITPPVVHSVVPLCKVGNDDTGNKLIALLERCGDASRNVDTKHIRDARGRGDGNARTALAVLPIFQDGRRGCFFDAASNTTFSADELTGMLKRLSIVGSLKLDTSEMTRDDAEQYQERLEGVVPSNGAFLFGYPHLLPKMQGEALAQLFREARGTMVQGGMVALDLNGVPEGVFEPSDDSNRSTMRTLQDLKNDPVIGAALEHVDILHMNQDELVLLTGCKIEGTEQSAMEDEFAIASAVNLFLLSGVAVVAVTRGKLGSFVSCNDEARFRTSPMLPSTWVDCTAKIGASELPAETVINSNGAGDAFTAGLLVAAMLRHTGMTLPSVKNNASMSSATTDKGSAAGSTAGIQDMMEESLTLQDISLPSPKSLSTLSAPKSKLTPYTLYVRENYMTLKQQCKDDKKALFSKCHEMWENETDEVKALYERKVSDMEDEDSDTNEMSVRVLDDIEALDCSTPRNDIGGSQAVSFFLDEDENNMVRNSYMTNRSLNLESAVQLASLVAAYHIDVNTRDQLHLDINQLLERAMVVPPAGLEEI